MSDHVLTPEQLHEQTLQGVYMAHMQSQQSRAHRFSNESPLSASSLGSSATSPQMLDTPSSTPGRIPPVHAGRGSRANPRNQGLYPTISGQMRQRTTVPQIPATTANLTAAKQEPKKPMTTVLSLLPKTTYKEANGAEGTEDTLAYLKVQQEVLKYLDTKPADTLTAQQACHWTEAISPNKHPRAQDALRLCYYMRSQTFDTYADIKNGSISLYVVNQDTTVRGSHTDMVYWRQSITDNEIIHRDTPAPTAGRRSFGVLEHVMTDLISRDHRFADLPDPHVPAHMASDARLVDSGLQEMLDEEDDEDDEIEDEDEDEYEDEEDDGEEHEGAEPAQNSLDRQLIRAQVNLHRLLASEPYDADAVDAALMQMEELNQQSHTE
ncbi:hypothetical protein P3342_003886 [Pyrenophora teres f. teres]|uniref:Uncharacterized protein n=2 Tax=Pyrenophora teres f. teres TaxID=97479 RepID=E3RTQ1_PYRTT|nr:hypothetical protein PTT_12405 [Pyrenophora teres f. teres 0-1]KAE8843029.1 hypothetical protein HRS9139_02326 [Pyrenophora teres f. teres]KAE8849914.1 hypothetical protein PTNB85_00330 [Pyrenophora teres f. teres]KAE8852061.1 hypothetical protein HRS9122_02348 [Pyrenophora teres f. teres]KAE8870731.1 hypothetical protein PTNB29_01075 [Pyrenophora teres f. teres]